MEKVLLNLTKGEAAALDSLVQEIGLTRESLILYALSQQFARFGCGCDDCHNRKGCYTFYPEYGKQRYCGRNVTQNRSRCNCAHYKHDESLGEIKIGNRPIPY